MRVLITRPSRPAAATANRLAEMGIETVLAPMAEPALDPSALSALLARKPDGDILAAAITSAQAAEALRKAGPLSREWQRLPFFAVGRKTADAARSLGLSTVLEGPGNGVELARMIAGAFRDMPERCGSRLFYFAGEPRSPDFEASLGEMGIAVATTVVYRMRPVVWTQELWDRTLGSACLDAVLLYSSETARLFFDRLRQFSLPQWQSTRSVNHPLACVCLSPAIADMIPLDARLDPVIICKRPDEKAMLEAMGELAG